MSFSYLVTSGIIWYPFNTLGKLTVCVCVCVFYCIIAWTFSETGARVRFRLKLARLCGQQAIVVSHGRKEGFHVPSQELGTLYKVEKQTLGIMLTYESVFWGK